MTAKPLFCRRRAISIWLRSISRSWEWCNASIYVNDVAVFEASYNVYDCIYFTDVCKELISKTFTL